MLDCSPEVKVGGVYSSKAYGDFEVLEIKNYYNVKIMFVLTKTVKITRACHVLSGSIKDNYFPSIFGEGYLGEIENCTKSFYGKWFAMMTRCYGDPTGESSLHIRSVRFPKNLRIILNLKNGARVKLGHLKVLGNLIRIF